MLEKLGLDFELRQTNTEEDFPGDMNVFEVARYLAEKKGISLKQELSEGDVLITADTVVILDGKILGKPSDENEAIEMLQSLSGKKHVVMTAVAFTTHSTSYSFDETTDVDFYEISESDILHYVEHFKPYDKAGAYGIQEWIGLVAVKSIRGCFFNVIGLPVPRLWAELNAVLSTL